MTSNANLEGKGRLERFHIEHGGKPIKFGGVWIYEDGATREENPMGMAMEPSNNPRELWRVLLKYREEAFKRAVKAFNELKELLEDDESAWAHEDENLRKLRMLRSSVRVCQRKFEEAQTKFAENDPRTPKRSPEQERQRAEDYARLEQRREKFAAALNKIKV